MKTRLVFAFLAILLASCAPAIMPVPTQTSIAPMPTYTPAPQGPTFTPTVEVIPVTVTPSPLPTQPTIPILTPDATQVQHWKEYQAELAKVYLSFDPDHPEGFDPEAYETAICEWDILGQSGQEMYIWADCISADGLDLRTNPAVIYLELDGTIRKVNIQRFKYNLDRTLTYDLHLFPIDVQEKLCLYYFFGIVPQCNDIVSNYTPHMGPFEYPPSRESVLILHLEYRRKSHADGPPLVVLSATPIPEFTPVIATVMPIQTPISIITPDAVQVERWKEYQTELIKAVLSGYDPASYDFALCEWDILGRSSQEVYVWAYCAIHGGAGASRPSVIYLKTDGSIRNVRVAEYTGSSFDLGLFPADVQEKRGLYTGNSLFNGRIREMINHIDYRETHPDEPPLVVLSATSMP
jgi:hypothetical protein